MKCNFFYENIYSYRDEYSYVKLDIHPHSKFFISWFSSPNFQSPYPTLISFPTALGKPQKRVIFLVARQLRPSVFKVFFPYIKKSNFFLTLKKSNFFLTLKKKVFFPYIKKFFFP